MGQNNLLRILVGLSLILLWTVDGLADCRVLTQQEMMTKVVRMSSNAYFSGIILGTAVTLLLLNALLYALRTKQWTTSVVGTGIFGLVVAGVFFIEASADSECGGALGSLSPALYAALLSAILVLSVVHFWMVKKAR